jgi:ABC-type sugar transport system ATPase subunit
MMLASAEIDLKAPALQPPALEVTNGWKSFGHVTALRDVELKAFPGEILAILGDNGAGKSTLVKVLAGVHTLDAGELRINGQAVDRTSPRLAKQHGVSTVFQDLAVIETLDIAANMFLGQQIRRGWIFANRRRMFAEAADSLAALGVRVPSVRAQLGELSGGQRQGVAIARAVREDKPIVLMDEPTAALGVRETAHVGEIIKELKRLGKCVILVSHDLEFVFKVADRLLVMRLGRVQGNRDTRSTDQQEVVAMITGLAGADEAKARS